jgi:2,5-furandicarboxylate decarboxylase 1
MDLRTFVASLDRGSDSTRLVRIDRPVDPRFEIAALVKLLKGRPVLFSRVRGHELPVVANVCATRDLVCRALGVERPQLLRTLADAIDHPRAPEVVPAAGYVELPADLRRLPILTYYPEDGGPYIASGVAIARDPEHGLNASFHRAMVRGPDRLGVRIVERHLHHYLERGLRELAFCVGNPVPVLLAAAISVELGTSELGIAAALGAGPLVDLDGMVVPAAEIVLDCEVTDEVADEGPFLDLTETFDVVRPQPVLRVRRIFARRDALFHALLPGDYEHKILMGMPREPTIFREVAKVCECLDVILSPGGCSWLHGIVKIRKRREDDGTRAIAAAFRGHPSMKHVFVVDEDVDLEDPAQVEWALATRFQGDRDLVIRPHEKGSSLDPSSDLATRETCKLGFDLTVPGLARREEFRRARSPLDLRLEDYL